MKKIFPLILRRHVSGTSHDFYMNENESPSEFCVCKEFVNFCGVKSKKIKFFVSTVRPHRKEWKMVRINGAGVWIHVGKKIKEFWLEKKAKNFASMLCHRQLFLENNTNVGWVKVEESV